MSRGGGGDSLKLCLFGDRMSNGPGTKFAPFFVNIFMATIEQGFLCSQIQKPLASLEMIHA